METPTAQALFHDRVSRAPEALAIEVIAARALIDGMQECMQQLRDHITTVSMETNDPELYFRGAGGLAAIGLLDDWLLKSLVVLNDTTADAASEPWE